MLKDHCSIWCCENNAFKQRNSDNHLLGSNNLNPIDGPAAPNCTAHNSLNEKNGAIFNRETKNWAIPRFRQNKQ